ncbi:MAG TPA: methyltransferase domain-containing protein [Rhodanobacteraceae bacterium]|nr:methyltransferase domain-containing protein [Rhodanobacteraceae bacterium]
MSDHVYDADFMAYTAASATRSADAVISQLAGVLPIRSVLDVGCARGAWLARWQVAGVADITGVDGDYVDRKHLLIPAERFNARDLASAFDLGRRFDLVQTLEVAEHIAADHADTFVTNLVHHASGLLLFSAAPPGQGGEFHVNEQPYDYWRNKLAAHGYLPFDCLRPTLTGRTDVSAWYRYNTLLYVHKDRIAELPEAIRRTAIAADQRIADISPRWYRLRKLVIRCLPRALQDQLARLAAKHG